MKKKPPPQKPLFKVSTIKGVYDIRAKNGADAVHIVQRDFHIPSKDIYKIVFKGDV